MPISFRAELERVADGHGFVTLYLAFKESPAKLGGVATTARLLGSLGFFRIMAASKKDAARSPR